MECQCQLVFIELGSTCAFLVLASIPDLYMKKKTGLLKKIKTFARRKPKRFAIIKKLLIKKLVRDKSQRS